MRKTLIAGAILSSLTLLSGSASAADVATVVGTGTISPGLPTTGCEENQSVTFSSTATINVGANTGVYNFTFTGGSSAGVCESLTLGEGSGTLSGDLTGNVSYHRSGNLVSVSGSVTLNGTTYNIVTAECGFIPTSIGPVTTYLLHCHVVIG